MNLLELTTKSLNSAAFVYLAAVVVFILALAKAGGPNEARWRRFGAFLVWVGFVLHTFGLGGRWVIGGVDRPPWTNLYESLIFFSYGIVVIQLWAQRKWKMPILGAVTMPLVFVLMGMSVMTPNKLVEPLIPSLQSNWLKIHVVFGVVAYAGFTVAACLAFLHLIRNRVSMSRIGSGLAIAAVFCLGIAGGKEVVETGNFYMARTVKRPLANGTEVWVKDTYREGGESGPMITRMEPVPQATPFFWAVLMAFAASAVLLPLTRKKNRQGEDAGEDISRVGGIVFGAALALLVAFFGAIGRGIAVNDALTLHSNPYLVFLLSLVFFFCAMYAVFAMNYRGAVRALPSADRLDELSYKNVLFAFPFQTLLLVTGAVWAYRAWGRSWGWDPEETWALITWFVYLIYLHGKLLMRWKPNTLSVVALFGFIVLVFAFLGVNLVLSGLHSYGAA